jgi:hypothetical protein
MHRTEYKFRFGGALRGYEESERCVMPRLRPLMDHQSWLEQHERMIADMDRMLRRAILDSVREARNERLKRREPEGKITQLEPHRS